MVNKAVGSIAIMGVFLDCIFIRGSDPKNETTNPGMHRKIMAQELSAEPLRTKRFRNDPITNGGGEALGLEMNEGCDLAVTAEEDDLPRGQGLLQFVEERDLVGIFVE